MTFFDMILELEILLQPKEIKLTYLNESEILYYGLALGASHYVGHVEVANNFQFR